LRNNEIQAMDFENVEPAAIDQPDEMARLDEELERDNADINGEDIENEVEDLQEAQNELNEKNAEENVPDFVSISSMENNNNIKEL
jgi:chlorite dismutase